MDAVQKIVEQVSPREKKLATAPLGKNGPQVTRLGYGAMGLVNVSPIRTSSYNC